MPVAERHAVRVEVDDAVVGDGDAEDVRGKIAQYSLVAFAPGGALDDPPRRPGCLG